MRKQHDYTECYERPCDPCDRAAHSLTDEEYAAATADAEQKQEPLTRNILVGLSMSKQHDYSLTEDFTVLAPQNRRRSTKAELDELCERIWSTTGIYPQLWVESRSLTPTLAGTARELGVSLYPSGGMPSETFVYQAAAEAVHTGRESMVVMYVGDYDPAGLQIASSLETLLTEHLDFAAEDYGMDAPELTFQRVAITEQQIADHALPTKPVKATQSRKRFNIADTVEAEAMRPDTMRQIVADAFEPMIDRQALEQLRAIEAAERYGLRQRMLNLPKA